jgi:hypothetical protein
MTMNRPLVRTHICLARIEANWAGLHTRTGQDACPELFGQDACPGSKHGRGSVSDQAAKGHGWCNRYLARDRLPEGPDQT